MKKHFPQPTRLKLLFIHTLANFLGIALAFYYFSNLLGSGVGYLSISSIRLVIVTASALVLFILGIILGYRWISPVWKWYQAAWTNPPVSAAPTAIQERALKLPLRFAKINLLVWFVFGLAAGLVYMFDQEIGRLSFDISVDVFVGLAVIAGPVVAAFVYFATERSWRTAIPLFFVGSDPTQVSASRLRIRTRVLILFMLGTLPLILLSILTYNLIVSNITPDLLLVRVFLLILVLGGGGVLLAAVLAQTLAVSVVKPFEELSPRLKAIQESTEVENIPVTSNDEVGELASHFNRMVHSLKRREEELNTIYQISREITDNLEIDATLQAILEQVREIIPYDGGEICLYDKVENVLRVRAWTSSAQVITDTRGRSYVLGEGYTGWVGAERKSLLIPDVDSHEGHKPTVRQIADGVFLNGFLGVPLLAGQKMVGTLEIVSTQK